MDSRETKAQVKDPKLSELEEISLKMMESILTEIYGMFPEDESLEVTLKVEIDEDWPYQFVVNGEVSSRILDKKTLETTLNKVIDKYVSLAEEELRKKGVKSI
jgi:hypothetical protein